MVLLWVGIDVRCAQMVLLWVGIDVRCAQMAPLLVLWAALEGLGVTRTELSLVELFAAFSVALVLTAFPITPGGLGTVDAALIALLIAFGVDSSTAVAADLLWRLVWFMPQLLVGALAVAKYGWDRRQGRHVTTS